MKKILIMFFLINLSRYAHSSIKENIFNKLKDINYLSFNFEQNING